MKQRVCVGVYGDVKTSRYRVKLPVVFGLAAAVLIAWQLCNQKIISQMGMAWDTGAPIWPYETPGILVYGFYFPALVLAAPLFWAFDLQMVAERYIAILPCSLLWWHLVGRRLDFGLVPYSWREMGKGAALLLVLLGLGIAYSGGRWLSRESGGGPDTATFWGLSGRFFLSDISVRQCGALWRRPG